MRTCGRIVAIGVLAGSIITMVAGPGSAAGGNGASLCSLATGPSGPYNLGADLQSHQPFNGDNNPGFAGPGFSPLCRT